MGQTAIIRPMRAKHMVRAITQKHLETDGYLYFQPKIDGMRVLFNDGLPRSRSWKVWTNRYLQAFARDHAEAIQGWDCEMLPGHKLDPNIFREAMSGLRSEDGTREFTLYLFDNFDPSWAIYPYNVRFANCASELLPALGHFDPEKTPEQASQDGVLTKEFRGEDYHVKVVLCPTFVVHSLENVDQREMEFLLLGWEGGMLRRSGRGYKYGQSTELEGNLTKVKRFKDGEAVITGVYQRERNDNEARVSNLGYTTRSAHQGNKVAQEVVGGFEVDLLDPETGKPFEPRLDFKVGVFKDVSLEEKAAWWDQREILIGKIITFKDQEYTGGYDKPRTPVFHGFRNPVEL